MFQVTINTDGAAFQQEARDDFFDSDTTLDHVALARALERVADRVRLGETSGTVRDVNGNTVGTFQEVV